MFKRPAFLRVSILGAWALTGTIAISSACATHGGRVYVRTEPPAPVYETHRVAPGPDFVWLDGYHHWDGRAYVWVPGRWERAPRAHAVWVPGRWAHDRRGWYFVQGHWR